MAQSREERLRQMREDSRASMDAALELLDDDLNTLQTKCSRLDEVKPETTDVDTYAKLMAEVDASTQKNESIAQLKSRIEALGEGAKSLAKTLATAAKTLT